MSEPIDLSRGTPLGLPKSIEVPVMGPLAIIPRSVSPDGKVMARPQPAGNGQVVAVWDRATYMDWEQMSEEIRAIVKAAVREELREFAGREGNLGIA